MFTFSKDFKVLTGLVQENTIQLQSLERNVDSWHLKVKTLMETQDEQSISHAMSLQTIKHQAAIDEEKVQQAFADHVGATTDIIDNLLRTIANLTTKVDELSAKVEELMAPPAEYDSEEPWVELVGTGDATGDNKGVEIRLDWNDAFIKQLRANGFDLPDEDDVVQLWLQSISANIAEEIKDVQKP